MNQAEMKTFSTKRGDITATLCGEELAVTYRGETRTFKAYVGKEAASASRVFGGKFKTGTKVWPLSVTCWFDSGNLNVERGGYSNKGGVSSILGWFDAESASATKSRGAR